MTFHGIHNADRIERVAKRFERFGTIDISIYDVDGVKTNETVIYFDDFDKFDIARRLLGMGAVRDMTSILRGRQP